MEKNLNNEPLYTIGIAAKTLNLSVHSLRLYEAENLIIPFKTETGRRIYSDIEIAKVRCIRSMIQEDGLNFEGIRQIISLVPCWRIRQCNSDNGKRCDRYISRKTPCWASEEKCINPLPSCRLCPVYEKLVTCEQIKSYIFESYNQNNDENFTVNDKKTSK